MTTCLWMKLHLPVDVFLILSVAEVRDEDRRVVEALDDGVHVASVPEVLQPCQPSTLERIDMFNFFLMILTYVQFS